MSSSSRAGAGVAESSRKNVRERVEERFVQGEDPHQVAEALGIKYDTLRKALSQGHVAKPLRPTERVDVSG